jgi:opacity protein-like surface antigen
MRLKLVLSGLLLVSALPVVSQIVPSATQGGIPITVGAAFSDYYTDFSAWESGITAWADWNSFGDSRLTRGLGVELEGRDLNFHRTGDNANLREQTGGAGPLYHWRHFDRIQPYGKFLVGFGGIYFSNRPGDLYTHDTRAVFAPGGGAEYRVWRMVSIRGDYEYQFWPDFFHYHTFNPYGITVGATYDFGRLHAR